MAKQGDKQSEGQYKFLWNNKMQLCHIYAVHSIAFLKYVIFIELPYENDCPLIRS